MKDWMHAPASLQLPGIPTLTMRIIIFIALLFVVRASTTKATLQQISDKVATHIKTLTDKAATTIHKLAEDIDFKKLDKLDIIQIFTKKIAAAKKHRDHELFVIDPYQVDRLKYYFEHTHGLKNHAGPHVGPHLQYGPPH